MRKIVVLAALLALCPWIWAQEACTVSYLGKRLTLDPSASRLGDECFVPLKHLSLFGWKANAKDTRLTIRTNDRKAEVFVRTIDGVDCFPLRATAQLLGATSAWTDPAKLAVLTRIEWIGASDGELSIKTTYSVTPKMFTLKAPDRLVIDLPGVVASKEAPPALKGVGLGVRYAQFDAETFRIVCDLVGQPAAKLRQISEHEFKIQWTGAQFQARGSTGFEVAARHDEAKPKVVAAAVKPKPPVVQAKVEPQPEPKIDAPKPEPQDEVTTPSKTAEHETEQEDAAQDTADETKPAKLGKPVLTSDKDAFVVTIPADRLLKGKTSIKRKEHSLVLEIPNATADELEQSFDDGFVEKFKSASKLVGQVGRVVLEFAIKGPVGVAFSPSAKQLAITLTRKPAKAGKISDQVIVVDPGHGGTDSGAHFGSGVTRLDEKTVNLATAKKVAKLLSNAGAAVILTRSDDSYPSLKDRVATANLSEATMFVSIHHNSNKLANSRSGTFTYYHSGGAQSKKLAECIEKEIAAVSGLPNHGAKADTTVHKTGMHVLRNTKMPAVLVEVGYINHATDREKITDEEFQNKVAEAVLKGVEAYLKDAGESQ